MPRILVVEDNEWSRDIIARRLSRRGYQVICAADGRRGIAMAHDQSPDLILMDMSLPEIDGWDAVRRLKADPATRAIPIVALTAHAMASDRKKAIDAGCDDYYTKPVDFESLVRAMEALLETRNSLAPTGILPPVVPRSVRRNPAALLGDPQC
jgi:CheY-like chemotaxis protein